MQDQDCSIKMCSGNKVGKLVIVTTASATFIFCFTTIIYESCAVFLPIVIEGQSDFRRTCGCWCLFHPLSRLYASSAVFWCLFSLLWPFDADQLHDRVYFLWSGSNHPWICSPSFFKFNFAFNVWFQFLICHRLYHSRAFVCSFNLMSWNS